MAKPSHGARFAGGKKKLKKRPESRPVAPAPVATALPEPVEETNGNGAGREPVLQFRPRAREAAVGRVAPARGPVRRAYQQVVDYSYVYTDLKIIGVLAFALFGLLVALSVVMR